MKKLNWTVAAKAAAGSTLAVWAFAGCGPKEETTVVETPSQTVVKEKTTVVKPAATPTPQKIIVEKPVIVKKTEVVENKKTVLVPHPTPAATNPPVAATPRVPTPQPPKPGSSGLKKAAVPTPLPPVPTFKPIARSTPAAGAASTAPSTGNLVVNATVLSTSKVPDPSTVAYSQSLVFTKFTVDSVEKGSYTPTEILVAQWGMKGKKLTSAARLHPGDSLRLTLVPLSSRPELEKVMRNDDTNEYELEPYFAVREN